MSRSLALPFPADQSFDFSEPRNLEWLGMLADDIGAIWDESHSKAYDALEKIVLDLDIDLVWAIVNQIEDRGRSTYSEWETIFDAYADELLNSFKDAENSYLLEFRNDNWSANESLTEEVHNMIMQDFARQRMIIDDQGIDLLDTLVNLAEYMDSKYSESSYDSYDDYDSYDTEVESDLWYVFER